MEASLKIHSGIDSSMEDPLSIVSIDRIHYSWLSICIIVYIYSKALEKDFFQKLELVLEPYKYGETNQKRLF